MKNITVLGCLILSLVTTACQDSSVDFQNQYFDVENLVNDIISENSATHPAYTKEAWINGEKESVLIDNPDWKKEMEVFLLADLNKRDYLNKYAKDSTEDKLTYTLLPEREAPVNFLEIGFKNNIPSSLTAILKTDNFLYQSERVLKILLVNGRLNSYEVDGWQELFIGDKKTYRLRVTKKGA